MRPLPSAYARLIALGMLVACSSLLGLLPPAAAEAAPRVRIVRDLSVPTTGGARIPIDVWQVRQPRGTARARAAKLHKVALLVHGGGWHSGDKRQWEQSRWAQRLVINGWIVVNANYRLACNSRAASKGEAERDPRLCGHAMRDSIADVRAALRYTAKHARSWGGDPNRIVLFGASAGGQLAMLAGSDPTRPSGVRAVVAIGPPTDLTWVGQRPDIALYASARKSIGCSIEDCPKTWRTASPSAFVRGSVTPPTWIFNSQADPITSIEPIRQYVAQLEQAQVPVRLVMPDDPSADCHGPIPCYGVPIEGGAKGDMFSHALTWLASYV